MRCQQLTLSITLFATLATFCQSTKIFVNRTCNSYNAQHLRTFNFPQFQGKWYEIAKYYNQSGVSHPSCTYHNITYNNFTHAAQVTTYIKQRNVHVSITNGTIDNYSTRMAWHSPAKNEENILILGTDYERYAILWNCIDHPFNVSSQNLYILSKYNLNPNELPQVGDILRATGVQNNSIPLDLINWEQCNALGGGGGVIGGGPGATYPGYPVKNSSYTTSPLLQPLLFIAFLFLFQITV